jgi:hypothetical protein
MKQTRSIWDLLVGCSLAALVLSPNLMVSITLAAPSEEQQMEEGQLRALLKKAGELYSAGDHEASGKLIADVQVRFDKLVNDGDNEVIALLDGVFQSLKKAHTLLELQGVKLPSLQAPVPTLEKITASTKLTDETYHNVRNSVLARPPKELWTDISWRPNLAEAIREAREQDKPILLWMMNGHPCGMT